MDLDRRASAIVSISEAELRAVIGGVGLGALLLHRHPGALVFAFGPLLGTPLTTSAKLSIIARSPATSRICDALSSSDFALEGKRTGFDALVIEGAAPEPSVLLLANERFDLVPVREAAAGAVSRASGSVREAAAGAISRISSGDRATLASAATAPQAAVPIAQTTAAIAQSAWTVPQTTAWLEGAFSGYAFATAGPAAHHGVLFACIVNGGRHAGRGGLGARLVQKGLLAIGVRGTTPVPIAHEARTIALAKDLARRSLGPATEKYRELGTVANLATFNRLAVLPSRNFQASTFEGAAALSGESLKTTRERGRGSCRNCTIGCEHFFEVRPGEPPQKVEYENVFALGPLCGISDPEIVLRASRLCDDLGMDTISTGATIAFAMECAERGLLHTYRDEAEDLRFGNGEKLLAMIDAIAHRRTPLADLLAQGTRLAAARLGPEAEAIAPHIKGLEIPGYDPRALQTMALGLSVAARGADHNKSGAYDADLSGKVNRLAATPEAARHAIDSEDRAALMDSLILCKFLRGALHDFHAESAEMLHAVTGLEFTPAELRATAARIVSLKKLWNERAGWTRAEDTLPPRFFDDPLPTGVARGTKLSRATFAEMQRAYYESRGWREDGHIGDAERAELTRWIGDEGRDFE